MTMQRIQRQPAGGYRSTWVAPRVGRGERVLLVLAGVISWLAAPAPASAACGPRDLTTCVNAAQYAFWQGVAGALWSVNRVLLTLTYQLDVLRAWLVETVFTAVFQIVTEAISPALAPIATIAVLIGVLCFLMMPVIGRVDIVNIRRALIWIVVAPLLLAVAGQGLASAEELRTTMGQTMFGAAQAIGSSPRFGAQSGEMQAATASLYPFGGCSGGALERPLSDGGSAAGIFMDDLAASMLYADAEDIHCPLEGSGPGTELPDGFYSPAGGGGAGGGDYATTRSVSDMDAAESAEWVAKIQRGVTRLAMGIIPSFLAVMNAIIQLLFALALVLLFIVLPLGLLLVFFTDTAAGVTGLGRRMVSVLQTSWSSSLLLGIVFVALLAASGLGNVAAFVGLSIAGILLTLFIIFVAVNAFMSSVKAIGQTVGMASGITGSAAKVALAGMTGGASAIALGAAQTGGKAGEMGLSYAVARRAGTSRRYALGTAAGRIGGVAKVGGLAAALGMGNEVTDGIYTGERGARSREGYRLTHRLATADAAKKDANQQTMREREQERDLQRLADRARRGSQLEEAGRIIGGGVRTIRHPVATARNAARAVRPGAQRITELSGDLAHVAWERVRAARDSVAERMSDTPTALGTTAAVIAAAGQGFTRDARSGRMVSNGRGGITFLPRVPAAELPAHALRERVGNVNAGRLLQLGHQLQYNPDGTVTFWHPGGPAGAHDQPGQTPPAPSTARTASRRMPAANVASQAGANAGATDAHNGAGTPRSGASAAPGGGAPRGAGPVPLPGAAASGSATGGAARVAPSTGYARRSRVYPVSGSSSLPIAARTASAQTAPVAAGPAPASVRRGRPVPRYPSHRIRWARGHRQRKAAAQQALANAETRLLLVRQGAVLDGAAAAEQAVTDARDHLATLRRDGWRLRPPVRGGHRLQPRQRRAALERQVVHRQQMRHIEIDASVAAGDASPAVELMEEAARHNQAIALNTQGVLVRVPNDAPPALRMEVPVAAVRNLPGLVQAGYRVAQSPQGDMVSIWPDRDAPGVRWHDAGTPRARPDLLREQRRLERQGLIAAAEATGVRGGPASAPGSRRRRAGPRRRTRP